MASQWAGRSSYRLRVPAYAPVTQISVSDRLQPRLACVHPERRAGGALLAESRNTDGSADILSVQATGWWRNEPLYSAGSTGSWFAPAIISLPFHHRRSGLLLFQ